MREALYPKTPCKDTKFSRKIILPITQTYGLQFAKPTGFNSRLQGNQFTQALLAIHLLDFRQLVARLAILDRVAHFRELCSELVALRPILGKPSRPTLFRDRFYFRGDLFFVSYTVAFYERFRVLFEKA